MTNYIVFVKITTVAGEANTETWQPFTAMVAHSPREAIRKALEGPDNPYGAGEYAAVPNRSWRPVSVTVETTTEVKIA